MIRPDKIAVFGPLAREALFERIVPSSCLLQRPHAEALDLRNNNADILVLSGRALSSARRFRSLKHVREVWLPLAALALALPSLGRFLLDGRLRPFRLTSIGGKRFLCLRVKDKKNRGISNRYFLPSDVPVIDFLRDLNDRGITQVYLRWPDLIRAIERTDDVDLLLSDEDAGAVRDLLEERIGDRPVDLHTVSGTVPGVSDGLAYFPPKIAQAILARRVVNGDGIAVPNAHDYLLSLAYHAVFHKGLKSGLGENEIPLTGNKYFDELDRLRRELGLEIELSLPGLLSVLEDNGWEPRFDVKSKLAAKNPWLMQRIESASGADGAEDLTVFVLRDIVRRWELLDQSRRYLLENRFRILAEGEIPEAMRSTASAHIRGGDWSPGNWPADGGHPYYVFAVQDLEPMKPDRATAKKSPFIANARPAMIKEKWREEVNKARPDGRGANFVHCSDNNREAFDYVRYGFADWEQVHHCMRQREPLP